MTSLEQVVLAWPKASEIQKESALNILTGNSPAFEKFAAWSPEPFMCLAKVAKAVGYHPSTLIRRGVHSIGHFAAGNADPRYRLSEVIQLLSRPGRKTATPTHAKKEESATQSNASFKSSSTTTAGRVGGE